MKKQKSILISLPILIFVALFVQMTFLESSQSIDEFFKKISYSKETFSDLSPWNGKAVLLVQERIKYYNFATDSLENVKFPISHNVKRLFVDDRDKIIAATKEGNSYFLYKESGNEWIRNKFPEELNKITQLNFAICSSGETAFIISFSNNTLHTINKNSWTRHQISASSGKIDFSQNHMPFEAIVRNDEILFWTKGYEFGERAGIYRLDSKNGLLKIVLDHMAVTDATYDKNGNIWFTAGGGHLNNLSAYFYKVIGNKAVLVSKTEGSRNLEQKVFKIEGKPLNWKENPTLFSALKAQQDCLILATSNEGLFKYQNDSWKRLTERWPNPVPIQKMILLPKNIVCLSVFGKGLIFIDRNSGRVEHTVSWLDDPLQRN